MAVAWPLIVTTLPRLRRVAAGWVGRWCLCVRAWPEAEMHVRAYGGRGVKSGVDVKDIEHQDRGDRVEVGAIEHQDRGDWVEVGAIDGHARVVVVAIGRRLDARVVVVAVG